LPNKPSGALGNIPRHPLGEHVIGKTWKGKKMKKNERKNPKIFLKLKQKIKLQIST
jgi:hypothetical protein